jgi:hypothetical protein
LKCNYGGQCEIDVNNRRICPSCRLGKCFTSGMHTEMIRSSLPNKINRTRKRKLTTNSVLRTTTVLARLTDKQSEQVRFFMYGIFSKRTTRSFKWCGDVKKTF